MTISLDHFSILNIRVLNKVRLETKQLFSIRSLCYLNGSIFQDNFPFLTERKKIQSCISLLLIAKFIYLIKFSLILILTTYKILFQSPFFINLLSFSGSKQICLVFPHPETNNCRTKLLWSFFLKKNNSIFIPFVCQQHISYLLYTLKCFPYHFIYHNFWLLNNFF